jgi:hypothetical protein
MGGSSLQHEQQRDAQEVVAVRWHGAGATAVPANCRVRC